MIMKKLFVSAFVALSMFAFVACESNPAIKATQKFLDEPTLENFTAIQDMEDKMSEADIKEYEEWVKENGEELKDAIREMSGF
jgi:uncharacterized protein YcfL